MQSLVEVAVIDVRRRGPQCGLQFLGPVHRDHVEIGIEMFQDVPGDDDRAEPLLA
jgi:hypothetical protein